VPILGISFQSEQDLLRVYDPDGQPVPFYFEKDQLLREVVAERDRQTLRVEEEQRRADDLAQQTEEQARQLEEEHQRIVALEAELGRLRASLPMQEDVG
jgi:hypothetical protein